MRTLRFVFLLLFLGLNDHFLDAQEIESAISQEKQQSDISELKILHSGFLSRDTLVIRYHTIDKKIVEVIDKGKKVSSTEFKKYESKMRDILELRQLNELLPAIEEVDKMMESPLISNSEKLEELENLHQHLEHMGSDLAEKYREIAEVHRASVLDDYIQEIVDSPEMSDSLKLGELKDLLDQSIRFDTSQPELMGRRARETEQTIRRSFPIRRFDEPPRDRRRFTFNDIHIFKLIDEILDAIVDASHLSESEKMAEMERIIDQVKDIEADDIRRNIAVKQFEWEVHKMLEVHGLLSEGESEFRLTIKQTKINGKKVPKDLHDEVLAIYEKYFGEPYGKGLTIVLGLEKQ